MIIESYWKVPVHSPREPPAEISPLPLTRAEDTVAQEVEDDFVKVEGLSTAAGDDGAKMPSTQEGGLGVGVSMGIGTSTVCRHLSELLGSSSSPLSPLVPVACSRKDRVSLTERPPPSTPQHDTENFSAFTFVPADRDRSSSADAGSGVTGTAVVRGHSPQDRSSPSRPRSATPKMEQVLVSKIPR